MTFTSASDVPTADRGAIQVSGLVQGKAGLGNAPVLSVGEVVQHAECLRLLLPIAIVDSL